MDENTQSLDEKGQAVTLESESEETEIKYLSGWRLHLLTFALCLCVFLVNLEITIVSTSLVTIAESFEEFDQTNWVVSAYLVTYTSFLIPWAKFSDIFGRKWPFLQAFAIFTVFSGGCGASQSMLQLVICRAFQGLGGSGSFSLATVIFFQMLPKRKIPLYSILVFTVVALAAAAGPLLGGVITSTSTWRWVFLLNVPGGFLTMIIFALVVPSSFPYNQSKSNSRSKLQWESISALLRKVDVVGTILLLAASLLLVTALLEAPLTLAWNSPTIICLLSFSAVSWISFFLYERYLTIKDTRREPTFPWRFFSNRIWLSMLLLVFFVGIPMTVITVDLPQRFQIVNRVSPLQAGIWLLPYSVGSPIGSFLGNLIAATTKARPIFLILVGSIMQLVGLAVLAFQPSGESMFVYQDIFLVITALGAGLTFSILVTTTPHAVEQRDLAVATGSIVQLRMMGSTIGLAVATTLVNNNVVLQLSTLLSGPQLAHLLQNSSFISDFPLDMQVAIESAYLQAFSLHFKVLMGLTVVQVLAVFMMWRKPQISLH